MAMEKDSEVGGAEFGRTFRAGKESVESLGWKFYLILGVAILLGNIVKRWFAGSVRAFFVVVVFGLLSGFIVTRVGSRRLQKAQIDRESRASR